MSKYIIHSTKEDYEIEYDKLRKIESTFKKANLDWKKIKRVNMDNLAVIFSIIERQVNKGLIELKKETS